MGLPNGCSHKRFPIQTILRGTTVGGSGVEGRNLALANSTPKRSESIALHSELKLVHLVLFTGFDFQVGLGVTNADEGIPFLLYFGANANPF